MAFLLDEDARAVAQRSSFGDLAAGIRLITHHGPFKANALETRCPAA